MPLIFAIGCFLANFWVCNFDFQFEPFCETKLKNQIFGQFARAKLLRRVFDFLTSLLLLNHDKNDKNVVVKDKITVMTKNSKIEDCATNTI